jgi:hypothetical protein
MLTSGAGQRIGAATIIRDPRYRRVLICPQCHASDGLIMLIRTAAHVLFRQGVTDRQGGLLG